MLYFANPSTPKVQAAMMRGDLGCILTPPPGQPAAAIRSAVVRRQRMPPHRQRPAQPRLPR